jgi:signal transduction histidine kinase
MINCPTILSGMSHEMRTHMNSIVAFSFLLNGGGCSEDDRKEFANHIQNSCEQLMVLFDNFLDSAIIDTGNSVTESGACNLDLLLGSLFSEFRVIIKREELNDLVLIQENQSGNNPELSVDSDRVTRVIRNLFLNALGNTSSGYIKIGYYFRDGNVTFYVMDSGGGFEKCREFLQTDNLTDALKKHNDTSSAVNLTLARKLVTLMGGRIWAENNGVTGKAIWFSIPARETVSAHVSINKYSNTRIAI